MQHPQKKKRKNTLHMRWITLIAAAAVVLAAAFVLLIPHIQQKYPAENRQAVVVESTFRMLDLRESRDVASATVFPKGADSYRLRMENGALLLEKDGAWVDVNDAYEQDLLAVFTQIVAQETVADDAAEVQEHMGDMGLEPPQARAEICYQDGSSAVIELGSAVPHTTYSYYRWSGDPGVYMCDIGIAETLSLSANQLLPVAQPRVDPSLVDEVEIVNAQGTSRFAFQGGAAGSLMEPYAYPLSEEAVERLLTALQNFRLGTREAKLTNENRAQYGLDQPLCTVKVHQQSGIVNDVDDQGAFVTLERAEQTLLFAIGRLEGEYFYTCEYEGECYFVSRFLAETLVGANPSTLITRYPLHLGKEQLSAMLIQSPQGTLEVQIERVERVLPNNQLALDAQGNVLLDARILFNGQPASQEQLDSLMEKMSAFAVAGDVPENFALSQDAQPRWWMALITENGGMRQVEAYRMDAFSDALAVDGVIRHYVHGDAMEAFMAGLLP